MTSGRANRRAGAFQMELQAAVVNYLQKPSTRNAAKAQKLMMLRGLPESIRWHPEAWATIQRALAQARIQLYTNQTT